MKAFVVSPEDSEGTIFGKTVSDLQTNIEVADSGITGTLKYVTDYTGFSGDPELQEGNYIALKVSEVPEDATMTVELVGGVGGPVTMDEDLNCVLRVTSNTQKVRFTCSKGTKTGSKTFKLTDLVLTPED